MSDASRLSPRGRWIFGGLFIAVGFFIMALSVREPDQVNGPWWLGFAAGGVFAAGGLAVVVQETPLARWVGGAAVTAIFLGFAAIGNWIAFGPGPRACTGGISFLFFSSSSQAGEMECRVAFGIGAAILDAGIFMGLMAGLAKLVGSETWAGRIKKVGEGVFFVALSPLLLLAGALLLVQNGGRALKARLMPLFRRRE